MQNGTSHGELLKKLAFCTIMVPLHSKKNVSLPNTISVLTFLANILFSATPTPAPDSCFQHQTPAPAPAPAPAFSYTPPPSRIMNIVYAKLRLVTV